MPVTLVKRSTGATVLNATAAEVTAVVSSTAGLTAVGTIATGVWQGTTIGVAYGGTGITAFGTGVATALGVNVGTAGAFVVNGGALGTPSSGTATNLTGLPTAGLLAAAVTYAKIQDVTALSVIGRDSGTDGVSAAVIAGSDYQILRRSGSSLGFGNINLASSNAVGATILPVANGGTGIAAFGTGIATALGINVGSAGAPVLFNGAGGTPSSLTGTNISGTAASLTAGAATILATARAINGVSFDGSAAITVTAAAGTLTGTTLAANVVTTSITSVGTITSGTWGGSPIAVSSGGTGQSSAGIASFNAITGYTAAGATGTTSTNLVFSTSPVLTTPNLGTPSALVLTNATGTPSAITLTNGTGLPVAGITASTSTALGVGSVELGHASDTTLARDSAGVLSVEGVVIPSISSTNTLTNKTLTSPTIQTSPVFAAATNLKLTVPSSDGTGTGEITNEFNSGYSSTAIGDLVYLDSSATWQKADADASATTYASLLGIALSVTASASPATVLLRGFVYAATPFPTFTIGAPVFMSATAGAVTQTAPTTTDSATRVLGYAVHADKFWFCPDNSNTTHT